MLPAWRRGGPRPSWPANDISVGYVSRIESGQRRPNSQTLDDLAARLGVPTEHLLRGVTAREYDEIKLTLDFAELSLETGQHLEAEAQARRGAGPCQRRLAGRARLPGALHHRPRPRGPGQPRRRDPRARAPGLLPQGRPAPDQERDRDGAAACASPATSTRAIEVGERVMAQLAGLPRRQLRRGRAAGRDRWRWRTSTAATPATPSGCAARRSSRPRPSTPPSRAPRRTGTPASSRPSAGSVSNAVPLAERALALLAEGQDARNLARLRTPLGIDAARARPARRAEASGTSRRRPRSWPGPAPARSRSRATTWLDRPRALPRRRPAAPRHVRRDHRRGRRMTLPMLAADARGPVRPGRWPRAATPRAPRRPTGTRSSC